MRLPDRDSPCCAREWPIHTIPPVSYDSFVVLCWNQGDNLRISEFEKSCVQLIASCVWALRNIKLQIKTNPPFPSFLSGYSDRLFKKNRALY